MLSHIFVEFTEHMNKLTGCNLDPLDLEAEVSVLVIRRSPTQKWRFINYARTVNCYTLNDVRYIEYIFWGHAVFYSKGQ